jgi:DNA-binding FrmR family transcriptional regulator
MVKVRTDACPACEKRHKKRTAEEQKDLLVRLKKAEGQIRGIEKMVEEDAYCPDILIQVSAVTSALNSFNKELLACHIRSCVAEDIREGKDESIDELVKVLQKLMK